MVDFRIAQRKSKESKLTFEQASEMFEYDPATGNLLWSEKARLVSRVGTDRGLWKRSPGGVAGTVNGRGYINISFNGARYLAHRVVWLLRTGEWPKDQIDHINKNRADNRLENLRPATNRSNHANRTNNSSGHVGVMWEKARSRWKAYARVGYRMHNIGRYSTVEEAVEARKAYLAKQGIET